MIGTYRISAIPYLVPEGEHKGRLNGATFTAASATDTREWFTINCGQFEGAFTQLMPGSRAKAIVTALSEGEEIELPGLYQEEQFNRGFIYEVSPVHFVLPPSIDPSGKSCVSRPACNEVQTTFRSSRPVSV
jgi:hypothetical protein